MLEENDVPWAFVSQRPGDWLVFYETIRARKGFNSEGVIRSQSGEPRLPGNIYKT